MPSLGIMGQWEARADLRRVGLIMAHTSGGDLDIKEPDDSLATSASGVEWPVYLLQESCRILGPGAFFRRQARRKRGGPGGFRSGQRKNIQGIRAVDPDALGASALLYDRHYATKRAVCRCAGRSWRHDFAWEFDTY